MSKAKDITGCKYNRLTAIKFSHTDKNYNQYWVFKCDCGNEIVARKSLVVSGHTKSCGCFQKEVAAKEVVKTSVKHGYSYSRIYRIWKNMISRCTLEGHKHYYEKGIVVCDEWKDDFECFYNWAMSNGYNDNLTIDRINPNSNYSPENCRWIPLAQQAKNTTQNKLITYNGKTMILADWARTLHIKRATISARLERGWSIEDALTKPVGKEAVNSKEFNNETI